MFSKNDTVRKRINPLLKNSGTIYLVSIIIMFVTIGFLTTVKPAYRFSSKAITEWTSDIDSSIFLHLLGMENRSFKQALPIDKTNPKLSTILFQIATNIKPNDLGSLLSQELPGLSSFGNRIIVAGEGTNYTNLSFESSPPLADVLKEREAILNEPEVEITEKEDGSVYPSTGEKKVVFVYNTHNRESFLPHLPGVNDPNSAHHREVNITKVSDRFAKYLEARGIGTYVDKTDHMSVLDKRGWSYGQSYRASRDVAVEAVATNKDLEYIFDLHRDSLPRKMVTVDINGKSYAKLLFVVGAEHANYEKNLALATELNALIKEKHPGLSRGVITKEGPGSNGIYNQDISENALLIEFGGYDNTLEELYRTADIVAEVFSEYYWDAEKVDAKP